MRTAQSGCQSRRLISSRTRFEEGAMDIIAAIVAAVVAIIVAIQMEDAP